MGACYKPGAFARPDRHGVALDLGTSVGLGNHAFQARSTPLAGVAELVDALDLGSSDESCGGSNPSARTTLRTAPAPQNLLKDQRSLPASGGAKPKAPPSRQGWNVVAIISCKKLGRSMRLRDY